MMSLPDFKEKQVVFALLSYGDKLSFKNDNLIIKDEDGETKLQITCYRLFAVFVIGHLTITSGLLQRAKKFGFSIVLMTHSLKVYGNLGCKCEGNVLLRKKQYLYEGFEIGAHIIQNKILTQIETLKKMRNKNTKQKEAIQLMEEYLNKLNASNLELTSILGIEGAASKLYFKNMFYDFAWEARRPRVKHDMINCLMDIGYTLIFNVIEGLLNVYGFDIYNGVLHRQFYQRKSLVCDLVEPFRTLIDSKIKKAINLGQCKADDFDIIQNRYNLYGKNSTKYLKILMEPIMENKQEIFLYIQQYYRAFMRNKPVKDYPVFRLEDRKDVNNQL
jgi:CRISPR-associated protein Cas1